MKKIIHISLSIFSLCFICVQTVSAKIVINEIGAFEKTDSEWIEIYNTGNASVDLSDWKFYENETNHGLTVIQGSATLNKGEYAIIAQKGEIFISEKNFSGKVFDSSWGTLKETGEEVGLKESQGEAIELFTYISAPNFSLERIDPDSNDFTQNNWKEHKSLHTAGSVNSVFIKAQNDLMPDVTATPTYIDETNTLAEILQNTPLPTPSPIQAMPTQEADPGVETNNIEKENTNTQNTNEAPSSIANNNNEQTEENPSITLEPQKTLEETTPKESSESLVLNMENSDGASITTLTQEISDEGTPDKKDGLILISDIKNKKTGSAIETSGTALVEPGILGSQIMYIADDNAGIQLYLNKKNWPNISLGDTIEIKGTISIARNEYRIKIATASDIHIVGRKELHDTEISKISELAKIPSGVLAQIQGEVTEIKGENFFVDDTSGEILIEIKKSTNIKKDIAIGDTVSIQGIVIADGDKQSLLPRYENDIKITRVLGESTEEKTTITNSSTPKSSSYSRFYLVAIIAGMIIVLIIFFKLKKSA